MAIIVYNRKNETHADSPNNFRIYRPFVLGNPYSWLPDRETKAIYKVANRDEALKASQNASGVAFGDLATINKGSGSSKFLREDGTWQTVSAGVTGVKGDSESSYRTGDVNITKSNIGLGNVGNFKAVSTVASQGLSDTEKSNARANIGAGTSSLAIGTTSSTALAGDTKYAGSASAGGSATSAEKLSNTSKVGDTNKPVYFTANGVPAAISYTIDKSVPSNAVFTDTDTKVTQTNTTTSADYRVLLSENANDTTQTVGARKSTNLKFNPSTGALTVTGNLSASNSVTTHHVNVGTGTETSSNYPFVSFARGGYYTTIWPRSSSATNPSSNLNLYLPVATGTLLNDADLRVISETDYANLTTAQKNDPTKIYFRTGANALGYPVQDNASATDLTNGYLPTGQTIKSYLNSNFDRYSFSFPEADKTVNASTWFSKNYRVQKGDIITLAFRSSATTGAFTRKITGSIGGVYFNTSENHSNFNIANAVVTWHCQYDEIITFESYTNTATTFSNISVTVTRNVIH